MTTPRFDIAIIGAGVVGCALARELSRYVLSVALLEAKSDLGEGVSKGNSAVLSTGSDTPPGSLEHRLVKRGHERYLAEAPGMGLPFHAIGSLTVAWNEAETARLEAMYRELRSGGFASAELVGRDAIYARVPHLAAGVRAAIWEPEEAIVDPFSTPYAYALDAVTNGVSYSSLRPVQRVSRKDGGWLLETPGGPLEAGIVVNCGGLGAAKIDALAGYSDFVMQPRRGQFIVFDKSAHGLLNVVLKPVPSPTYRGVLITPTMFGNILLGPTSEEVDDLDDWRTTPAGMQILLSAARRMLPSLLEHEITATYCGIRPATDRPEYRIIPRMKDRWFTVGGIRSTGLSGALGIAEHVTQEIISILTGVRRKTDVVTIRVPNLAWDRSPAWANGAASDECHEIICHCEQVTLAEIKQVLASPLPPRSLKTLKRRTRAMFGRCQGFFCGARVQSLFAEAPGAPAE